MAPIRSRKSLLKAALWCSPKTRTVPAPPVYSSHPMDDERWRYTCDYLIDVFGAEDEHLTSLTKAARAAGLPAIAISPDVGRLLKVLTSMTRGELAVEVGTLAGYSATWILRGLAPSGRLITIESDREHATFAKTHFDQGGFGERVEVRIGPGLEELERLRTELPPRSVDVLFLDADKVEYPAYFSAGRELIAPGGLLLADNALGSSEWWIDEEGHPAREGAHRLNLALAADPDFEAVAVPQREGLLVARRSS